LTYNVSSVIEHISTKNASNCSWTSPLAYEDLHTLGNTISATGAEPLISLVSAIQDFLPPSDVQQLQQFLGMIKFYCHCLPNIAQTLKSLNEALKGSTKHFKWSARFYVDASASHAGAVLQYIQNRGWVPLSFFSKQLD